MSLSIDRLQRLQEKLVDGLEQRLEADIADNVPTDAATLGVIVKLLKDNNVVVSPEDKASLNDKREELARQSAARAAKRAEQMRLVKSG